MNATTRRATAADLPAMAELAAHCQADPATHCVYLGDEAESIATDIDKLDHWTETAAVAETDGRLSGWLVAEVDIEMGRIWWWGPFVAAADGDATEDREWWTATADRLYDAARTMLPAAIVEEEACGDARSERIEGWCERHGLVANPASVLLRRAPGETPTDPRIRPLAPGDHEPVRELHELNFSDTHTTPAALVAAAEPRLVLEVDGRVIGYVAYELQSDRSGYIDYLAVADSHRGRGLGGALVDHACHELFAAGAIHANLTVREDNAAARALYRRVGFVEERLARPYRRGFQIP